MFVIEVAFYVKLRFFPIILLQLHLDTLVTLEQMLSTIQEMLAAGDLFFIRNFGTFSPKKRAAKTGRNY